MAVPPSVEPPRSRSVRTILAVAGLAVAGLAGAALAIPSALAPRLLADLGRRSGLTLAADGPVRLSPWPFGVVAHDIAITRDGTPLTRLTRLDLTLDLGSLPQGRVTVAGVGFSGLALPGGDTLTGTLSLPPHGLVVETRWRDRPLRATLAQDGGAVTASLDQVGGGLSLRFSGRQARDGVDGTLEVDAPALATLMPGWGLAPAAAVTARGTLRLGDGQASWTDIQLTGPGSQATGQISVLTGQPALIEANLAVDTVDADQWFAAPPVATITAAGSAAPPPITAAESPSEQPPPTAAAMSAPSTPPVWSNLFANLDLAIGTVVWGGVRATSLRAEAGLEPGALILRHAGATLADGTRVSGDGSWEASHADARLRVDGPKWQGRAQLATTDGGIAVTGLTIQGAGHTIGGQARVVPGATGVGLSRLDLNVDGWPLSGDGRIDWRGGRPSVVGALRLTEATAATRVAPPAGEKPPTVQPKTASPGQPKTASPSSSKTASPSSSKTASLSWLDRPLDLTPLAVIDADLTLSAPAITLGQVRLDHPSLRLTNTTDGVRIRDFQARLGDGGASGSARIAAGSPPSLQLSARLAGADLARLAGQPSVAGIRLDSLRADMDANLTAHGATPRALLATLAGPLTAHSGDGRLSGVDMAGLNRQLGHVDGFGNVLTVLGTALGGGTTPITAADATCAVAGSILTCTRLSVRADGAALTGDGTLGLDRDAHPATLRSSLALTMDALPDAPLRLKIDGPVQQPAITVDANALQRALVRSGLGQTLKGDGGDGKVRPREVLKGLWRALGGRD